MPETGAVEVAFGAYAANVMPGDPVWLLEVGPPSSGKGEILGALGGLPHLYPAATLTEAALLSGVKADERAGDAGGGLLREMSEFGILVLKDATSILSQSRETRTAMLAALREIFDGAWTRRLGVDGGRCLSWHGKMGLLGGVTQALDSHHGVMAEMGPRFILYRLPPVEARQQARRALSNAGQEGEMRNELRKEVRRFFDGLNLLVDAGRPVSGEVGNGGDELAWLVLLVEFASRCRSAVERHPYTREILLVPEAEGPARLARSAAQLLRGLEAIGVHPQRRRELVAKVMLDCIPPVRRAALDYMANAKGDIGASIVESAGLPKSTLQRALEDLKCHGIVRQTADGWQVSSDWTEHMQVAYPSAVLRPAKISGRVGTIDE